MDFRILHTADWHLDARFLEEQKGILAWIQARAEGLFPDLIVVAGDLWHTAQELNDQSAVRLGFDAIRALSDVAPVLIVKGNNEHDRPGSISWLTHTKGGHPIVAYESPKRIFLNLDENAFSMEGGDVLIHVVPYPTKAFVQAGMAQAVGIDGSTEEAVKILDAYFKTLGAESMQFREGEFEGRLPGKFVLGVGHFNVGGSVLGNGQTLVSQDIMIPKSSLGDAACDYWALGHIHKQQDFALTHGRARYAGTFFHKDFGELEGKSITVVDMTDASDGKVLVDLTEIPTPSKAMMSIDATVEGTEIGTDVGAGWKDTKLRVRLRGTREALAAVQDRSVEDRFPGAYSYKVERIPSIERDIRSKTIQDRRSFPDQVFDWLEATGKTTDHPNLVRKFAEKTESLYQGENPS